MKATIPTDLLLNSQTSLGDLSLCGWEVECNGPSTYFRNIETRAVHSFPFWVTQLVSKAAKEAKKTAQSDMRAALGIES